VKYPFLLIKLECSISFKRSYATSLPAAFGTLLEALLQNSRLPLLQIQNALSKQSIRPAEPLSRPDRLVEGVDTLMDQSQSVGSANNLLQSCGYLLVVTGCEDPHDTSHGPGLSEPGMRSTDTGTGQFKNESNKGQSYALITGPRMKYGLSSLRINLRVVW
jgi:hypothetical protein